MLLVFTSSGASGQGWPGWMNASAVKRRMFAGVPMMVTLFVS
jgi:PhoPQ-activated pathogenicity-related protein